MLGEGGAELQHCLPGQQVSPRRERATGTRGQLGGLPLKLNLLPHALASS